MNGNVLTISWKNLFGVVFNGKRTEKELYQEILPEELQELAFPGDQSDPTNSKVINGSYYANYKKVLLEMSPKTGETAKDYENRIREYVQCVNDFWITVLERKKINPESIKLQPFLNDPALDNSGRIRERLELLVANAEKRIEVLTALTFLSVTKLRKSGKGESVYWDDWSEEMLQMIFPVPTPRESRERGILKKAEQQMSMQDYAGAVEWYLKALPEIRNDPSLYGKVCRRLSACYEACDDQARAGFYWKESLNNKEETTMLEYARICKEKGEANKCYRVCIELVTRVPRAKGATLREIYYILYQLIDSGEVIPEDGNTAEQCLKRSAEWGYEKARIEYQKNKRISLIWQAEPAEDTRRGNCWFSTENVYTKMIRETMPTGWTVQEQTEGSKEFEPFQKEKQKAFFLDEDEQKNLDQLPCCLQKISEKSKKDPFASWSLELYIRGREEYLAPLIDTALHHLGDWILPVYLLDDAKLSAQRLLARHPLLYPVRDRKYDTPKKETLNFVVLGSTKTCEWLVREAFYLLTTKRKNLKTKITILAPDAEQFLHRLYGCCPGLDPDQRMAGLNGRQKTQVTDLYSTFTQIETGAEFQVDFQTDSWRKRLDRIAENGRAENEKYYFAIDAGNDLENLKLAVQLREWSVRRLIAEDNLELVTELPVIAFRCEEDNVARLSRNMCVSLADHGDEWYNNHALT
ncbi:MAG: hypothetical protein MR332_02720 [Fusicatenibacter sp.]|nr:hypothetical protein [Fusicatenibacter sp.]